MANHTPGPWSACFPVDDKGKRHLFPHVHIGKNRCVEPEYYVNQYGHREARGRRDICINDTTNGAQMPEHDANAHLIAKAPELLEALSQAEKIIRDLGDRLHTYGTPVSFVFANKCRDLVREATEG